jgi:transcriptional regulator of arginine metabolism
VKIIYNGGILMKNSRQSKIIEIIENNVVETQEELAELLRANGINITQATVSRDIKELRLIKVLDESGRYKYAMLKNQDNYQNDRLVKMFADSVINIDYSGNMIVLKTIPGTASAAAAAIDGLGWKEIIGSLAGDDAIFIVVRENEDIRHLVEKFENLVG